jgi:hypothetical protein
LLQDHAAEEIQSEGVWRQASEKEEMIRLAVIVSLLFSSFSCGQEGTSPLRIVTNDTTPYVGRVQMDGFTVRLLVLKHCLERMADNDAQLAIEAANLAAEQGLTIQNVGEFYINRNGRTDKRRVYSRWISINFVISS